MRPCYDLRVDRLGEDGADGLFVAREAHDLDLGAHVPQTTHAVPLYEEGVTSRQVSGQREGKREKGADKRAQDMRGRAEQLLLFPQPLPSPCHMSRSSLPLFSFLSPASQLLPSPA